MTFYNACASIDSVPVTKYQISMGVTAMQKFNNFKVGVIALFANIPVAVKVITIAAMTLTSLYLTGLLNINHQVAHYLGYAMSVLTLYVALKSVK